MSVWATQKHVKSFQIRPIHSSPKLSWFPCVTTVAEMDGRVGTGYRTATGVAAVHNDTNETHRHTMWEKEAGRKKVNTVGFQLYKINQAKLTHVLEVRVRACEGKEAEGAFGSSVVFLHRVLGSWVLSLCEDLARCGFRSCAVFCLRVVLQLRLSIKTPHACYKKIK